MPIRRYLGVYYVIIFMKIDLLYMSDLNKIASKERTHLKNNINSLSTIPKEAYVNKATIDVGNINRNMMSNSVLNKIQEQITKNNMKPLKKGDIVVVDKIEERPYIFTEFNNLKPVSWRKK